MNFSFSSPLVLAPMSGVTSSAFRRLIKEFNPEGVGYMVSEFISIEGLSRLGRKSLLMMKYCPSERPLGIQIFGYDIERMCQAAEMVQESGVDVVDINSGCPAPKVVRRGGGCELMRQPAHLAAMLKAVRKRVSIPLTLKIRAGWDDTSRNALEIAKIAEGEGIDALAVHGRTRAEMYRGSADWELIETIVDALTIPIFGSGDVVDVQSAEERLKSGVKGLYIGRGAITNPIIFSQINHALNQKKSPSLPSLLPLSDTCMKTILLRYRELLLEEMSEIGAVGKLKQLASQMAKGKVWLRDILRSLTFESQLEAILNIDSTKEYAPLIGENSSSPLAL